MIKHISHFIQFDLILIANCAMSSPIVLEATSENMDEMVHQACDIVSNKCIHKVLRETVKLSKEIGKDKASVSNFFVIRASYDDGVHHLHVGNVDIEDIKNKALRETEDLLEQETEVNRRTKNYVQWLEFSLSKTHALALKRARALTALDAIPCDCCGTPMSRRQALVCACKLVYYCSPECRRKDWEGKGHRLMCRCNVKRIEKIIVGEMEGGKVE